MGLRFRIGLYILAGVLVIGAWEYIQWRSPDVLRELQETLEYKGEVITPPPLRGELTEPGGTLTVTGVFAETNRQRQENNQATLDANETLNQAARAKLQDMFAQQYFEHEGPDGKGPADWVEGVGYQYIRVGENLALGNFKDDADLVQAWMDSPGHRANILHPGFTEIGIAVGLDTFEDRRTWLAVQTFALPASACPAPDAPLAATIESLKESITTSEAALPARSQDLTAQASTLASRRQEIEQTFIQAQESTAAGNAEIAEGNRIYEETGSSQQAQPQWDNGKELQAQGEALLREARAQEKTYTSDAQKLEAAQLQFNADVTALKMDQARLQSTITTYNQQVRAFNDCAQ